VSERAESSEESLPVGTCVDIVKLKPDGSEAIRYPGSVIASPSGWVAVQAPWGQRRVDLGYLVFEPNDIFLEFFSLREPLNVFSIFTHDGVLKGWYCNVTRPSWVSDRTIYWHDLYIDVVAYPDDARPLVLDEDELAEAAVEQRDPALFQLICAARTRLLQMVATCEYPFTERRLPE